MSLLICWVPTVLGMAIWQIFGWRNSHIFQDNPVGELQVCLEGYQLRAAFRSVTCKELVLLHWKKPPEIALNLIRLGLSSVDRGRLELEKSLGMIWGLRLTLGFVW